ncbi:hypothetical protein B0H21DRAFT_164673 [Amylocystis lapponica]|nr:hypothetical protein B0H21DRAFT_164673 [Amylocystis lapponica]
MRHNAPSRRAENLGRTAPASSTPPERARASLRSRSAFEGVIYECSLPYVRHLLILHHDCVYKRSELFACGLHAPRAKRRRVCLLPPPPWPASHQTPLCFDAYSLKCSHWQDLRTTHSGHRKCSGRWPEPLSSPLISGYIGREATFLRFRHADVSKASTTCVRLRLSTVAEARNGGQHVPAREPVRAEAAHVREAHLRIPRPSHS